MNEYLKVNAKWLQRKKEKYDLTYADMSEICGIDRSNLCRYHNGDQLMSVATKKKICEKFKAWEDEQSIE